MSAISTTVYKRPRGVDKPLGQAILENDSSYKNESFHREFGVSPETECTLKSITETMYEHTFFGLIMKECCTGYLYTTKGSPIMYLKCDPDKICLMEDFDVYRHGIVKANNKMRGAFHSVRVNRSTVRDYGMVKGENVIPDIIIKRLSDKAEASSSGGCQLQYWRSVSFLQFERGCDQADKIVELEYVIKTLNKEIETLRGTLRDHIRGWEHHKSKCPLIIFRD